MKKDPVKTAQEILKAFGGKENVISATHCATRLRVEVKDASVIDEEGMKEIQGVAGYFSKSGQHQVILGTGFVNKVCAEFQKLAGVTAGDAEVTENGEKEKLSFQSTTKMISDIFIPIIRVLLATGILMGVRSLLVNGLELSYHHLLYSIFCINRHSIHIYPSISCMVCMQEVRWLTDPRYCTWADACITNSSK